MTVGSQRLPIKIQGVPPAYSSATAIDLTFVSDIEFKAHVSVSEGGQCESPETDRPWQENPQTLHIEPIGADGPYSLCVVLLAKDPETHQMVVDPLSVVWIKDTKIPELQASLQPVYSAASTSGPHLRLGGTAIDEGSGLKDITYVVQRLSDQSCYQEISQTFISDCAPQKVTGREAWSVAIPEASFASDGVYELSVRVADRAGNAATNLTHPFTWDATPPGPGTDFQVALESGGVALSWQTSDNNVRALLVRTTKTSLDFTPQNGQDYRPGEFVADATVVVYAGEDHRFKDTPSEQGKTYGYALFLRDEAGNYSSPSLVSVVYVTPVAFLGLGSAYIRDTNFNIALNWKPYASVATPTPEAVSYQIYTNQNATDLFNGVPTTSVVNASSAVVAWPRDNPTRTAFTGVRASDARIITDQNTNVSDISVIGGAFHRIAGNARSEGDAGENLYIGSPLALAYSIYGNLVFTSASGIVSVLCNEVTQEVFCAGRNIGKIYTIAGSNGLGDGQHEDFAEHSALGDIVDLTFDRWGNLFLADARYYRIRVICYEVTHPGACYLKKVGYSYNLAGTGALGDSRSGAALGSAAIGTPGGIAVDSYGNVVFGDQSNLRLRVACLTSAGSICSNSAPGYLYTISGSREMRDGQSGERLDVASFGQISAVQIDAAGNILFADQSFYRVRQVCLNQDLLGTCEGKSLGRLYNIMGRGTLGDGGHGSQADTNPIGTVRDIKLDHSGQLLVSDASFYRIRMLCFNTNPNSPCSASTPGNMINLYGSGSSGDALNGTPMSSAKFGSLNKMALDVSENLLLMDSSYRRLRLICRTTQATCNTRNAETIYNLIGTGTTRSPGNGTPGFNAYPGVTNALATDPWGNVYWSDIQKYRIMVLCTATQSDGYCAGKTPGFMYYVAGTGRLGDGADGTPAISSSTGEAHGIAIDSWGNIYWGDRNFNRIRAICINTSSGGFCNGKISLQSYRIAGSIDGSKSDAFSNVEARTSGIGMPNALAIDSSGNVYFSDDDYWRVRVICYNNTADGFCKNRMIGGMFRYAGKSGTAGTGDGDTGVPSNSTPLGKIKALAFDAYNNLLIADESFYRIRVICTKTQGVCTGKITGNIYWLAGNGSRGDAAGGSPSNAAIGSPVGLALDSVGNIFIADASFTRVRLLCRVLSGACSERSGVDTMYRLTGSGLSDIPTSNTAGQAVNLQPFGNASMAPGLNDSVVIGATDGGIGLITTRNP
jgi:hypothetical protein